MLDCLVNCPRQLKPTILGLTYSLHPYSYSLWQLFSNFHVYISSGHTPCSHMTISHPFQPLNQPHIGILIGLATNLHFHYLFTQGKFIEYVRNPSFLISICISPHVTWSRFIFSFLLSFFITSTKPTG